MAKKDVIYVVDDSIFQVPDEIKNMTHEERMKLITELESEEMKEEENLSEPILKIAGYR